MNSNYPVGNQESLTGNGTISTACFHSKVYTNTPHGSIMKLGNGQTIGQLKKITFVSKASDVNILINCASLPNTMTQILMLNVGDHILLMWSGTAWIVLETLNSVNPAVSTPIVQ